MILAVDTDIRVRRVLWAGALRQELASEAIGSYIRRFCLPREEERLNSWEKSVQREQKTDIVRNYTSFVIHSC